MLLLNQFHDILPGSSISEVYEDAHRELEETVNGAEELRDEAIRELVAEDAGSTEGVILANAALHPRPLTALLAVDDGVHIVGADGEPLPAQRTAEGLLVHAPGRRVPGLGWTSLALLANAPENVAPGAPPGVRARRTDEADAIENEHLRVEIGADGSLDRKSVV